MGKKKILFISNGYGDSPVISGGEVRLYNLIKQFSFKFGQSFITTRGGLISVKNNKIDSCFKTIYTSKNRLLGLKEITGLQRLLGYFISAFDSVKIMKSGSWDALYTSTDYFCDIYPSYIYKITNPSVKWFCMLHHKYDSPFKRPGFFPVNAILYLLQLRSFRMIAKRADCVFVLETEAGEQIAQTLIKYGYKGQLHYVKNGINKMPAVKTKKDKSMAVYLGGLRPSKGLYDIIPVWKKVREKNPKLKLTVIGKGSDKDMKYLKENVEKNRLSGSVTIAGYVDAKNLNILLSKAYVFFLPSREEGWGISILEALQHGCIPVVYDLPAFKVFKNHIVRIPRFDHGVYAEELLKAFKSKGNGVNKKFIAKFYWSDIAKKELSIIKMMVGRSDGRRVGGKI